MRLHFQPAGSGFHFVIPFRYAISILLFIFSLGVGATEYDHSAVVPPAVPREFRGVWVATVGNTDWPSKPGLSTPAQKNELIAILNRAVDLKLNAIIFQVRPQCDALYQSALEPWSEYLTGTMGKAPDPFYDPLAFAVTEAHLRGLELHAWFNPYRARNSLTNSPASPNHISRTTPRLVRRYGSHLWLDPGEPEVQAYSLRVVMDVVNRYDIDGVHFDDYFYPYPEKDASGHEVDFPDEASWRMRPPIAGLHRDDWRRANVDAFIQRVYQSIKAVKPWVKFGISPFGIWRPGNPKQIKGFDAYEKLYADSRKWLSSGWLDYFTPQLYWPLDPPDQSLRALLPWWEAQNPLGRRLWPGLGVYNMDKWKPDEIPRQIEFIRSQPGASGYVLYNAGSVARHAALDQRLQRDLNGQIALIPATPWLNPSHAAPAAPYVFVTGGTGHLRLSWVSTAGDSVRWWLIQERNRGAWTTTVLPGGRSFKNLGNPPDVLSVTAIDRTGIASSPTVVQVSTRSPDSGVKAKPQ